MRHQERQTCPVCRGAVGYKRSRIEETHGIVVADARLESWFGSRQGWNPTSDAFEVYCIARCGVASAFAPILADAVRSFLRGALETRDAVTG